MYLCKKEIKSTARWSDIIKLKLIYYEETINLPNGSIGINNSLLQQNFENTDPEGFAALIADTTVVVLDARTAEEFKDGHIANAQNIDVKQDDFVKKALATLPKNKTVAVYCRSGRRSANAAGLLAKKGYKCVNLYGGILAWIEAGKPVVQDVKE